MSTPQSLFLAGVVSGSQSPLLGIILLDDYVHNQSDETHKQCVKCQRRAAKPEFFVIAEKLPEKSGTTQNAESLSPIDDSRPAIETSFVDEKEQTPEKEQAPAADSTSEKKEEKTKKHRKTNHCREDHEHKQLIVTKETSKPGTAAFNELMEKRKLYPDYTITYRTANSSDRLSVKGLTVKDMEKFIELNYPGDEKRLSEFNLQSQLSELYPAPIMVFQNRMMGAVMDRFGSDIVAMKEDNTHFRISVSVAVSQQFFAWVFGLGKAVRIVAPESVKEQMKKALADIAERYE